MGRGRGGPVVESPTDPATGFKMLKGFDFLARERETGLGGETWSGEMLKPGRVAAVNRIDRALVDESG